LLATIPAALIVAAVITPSSIVAGIEAVTLWLSLVASSVTISVSPVTTVVTTTTAVVLCVVLLVTWNGVVWRTTSGGRSVKHFWRRVHGIFLPYEDLILRTNRKQIFV